MLRTYLPRLVIVLVATPVAFVAALYVGAGFGIDASTAAAIVTALTFALVITAPSARNAAVRAALVAVPLALAALIVLLTRSPS